MKLYVKFDFNETCKQVLKEQLDKLGIPYTLHGINEIEFMQELNPKQRSELQTLFEIYHIELLEDQHIALVQRIKTVIDEMLVDEESRKVNASDYLADKLNYSYTYLSTLFSEATYSSIEHYTILRKVDFVKDALMQNNDTLTEIAFRFNYSSVGHLSNQFKKTTGLTPSMFQKIIKKRKLLAASKS